MNDRPDDWQLLDAYGTTRSEDAFARLVARHADLVYHAALRRTRRPDLAEDVAQAVFITLARSAGRLRPRGSLAAWLHQTALFASASALRSESRRRRHERAAAHDPSDQTGTSFESSNGEIDPATEIEQALH